MKGIKKKTLLNKLINEKLSFIENFPLAGTDSYQNWRKKSMKGLGCQEEIADLSRRKISQGKDWALGTKFKP